MSKVVDRTDHVHAGQPLRSDVAPAAQRARPVDADDDARAAGDVRDRARSAQQRRGCASMGRGDRHPVLVLPGFMGDDASTVALRFFIRSWGYWSHGWGMGQNLGPTPDAAPGHQRPARGPVQPARPAGQPGRLEPRRPLRPVPRPQAPGVGAPGDHARLAAPDARGRPGRTVAALRPAQVELRPGVRRQGGLPAGTVARAVDDDLLAHRRRGPLAGVHRRRRRAARQRRGHAAATSASASTRRRCTPSATGWPSRRARGSRSRRRACCVGCTRTPPPTTRKDAFGVAESPRRDRAERVDRLRPCDPAGAHVRAGWPWRSWPRSVSRWSRRYGPTPRQGTCPVARCYASPYRRPSAARRSSGN